MKLSSMLCTSVIALAVFTLSNNIAFAAANLNSSKSNVYRLDPTDPNAAANCAKAGGTVKDKDGQKICSMDNQQN